MTGKNTLALMKKDVVDVVEGRIQDLIQKGELHLPEGYSAANAIKSAWLTLQSTVDRDKKPALQVCTRDSIANALLDMVVQGLNPAKNQCYFIVYGSQLVCMRSYFGAMHVAKMVDPTIGDIIAQVVYEGDEFRYSIERGKKVVTKHEQSLSNVQKDKIIGAYCMVLEKDGTIRNTEIMTWDEILQSWKQSQVKPVMEDGSLKAGTTHEKYPAQMALRTVVNRACKPIINSSSDEHLLQAVNRASDIEIAAEIAENANGEVLDVEAENVENDDIPVENAEKVTKNDQKATKQETLSGPGF
jgi:recombination protein RecT